jgi:hypothetical protein
MHTRSTKSKITGKFTVTVIDWNGVECFRGEFADVIDAERAAAREERAMTLRMQQTADGQGAARYFDAMEADDTMTDDELLAALGA